VIKPLAEATRLDIDAGRLLKGRLRMHIMQSRRDFLAGMSVAGAASVLGARGPLADEAPPETTTIRIRVEDAPPLIVGGLAETRCASRPL
jgi:hypothetical protein